MSRRLRLMGDRILVRVDPDSDKTVSGSLFKPEGAHESILQTGEVLDVGPGKWSKEGDRRISVGVEPGEGVLFVRFVASSTKTAEALQHHLEEGEALLGPQDILMAYDRKNPPEFA